MKTKFFYLLLFVTVVGCDIFDVEVDRSEETATCDLKLQDTFSYDISQDISISTDIGLWMFCRQELVEDAIADWNKNLLDGKRLLEPINVIWIDLTAEDMDQARANVWEYLASCGLGDDGYGHSGPYHAKYATDWISQDNVPQTDEVCDERANMGTWSDFGPILANNHGRVFSSSRLQNGGFITLGAFSRENNASTGHAFISFDEARDILDRNVAGWSRGDGKPVDIGNIFMPQMDCEFTTSSKHNGVRVFVYGADSPASIEGTWVGSGQLRNTNCTDEEINKTFDVDFVMVLEESGGETGAFTGTLTASLYHQGVNFTGQDAIAGNFDNTSGTFEAEINGSFGGTTHAGTISGSISGETLTFSYSSEDISGETCTTTGNNIVLTLE